MADLEVALERARLEGLIAGIVDRLGLDTTKVVRGSVRAEAWAGSELARVSITLTMPVDELRKLYVAAGGQL